MTNTFDRAASGRMPHVSGMLGRDKAVALTGILTSTISGVRLGVAATTVAGGAAAFVFAVFAPIIGAVVGGYATMRAGQRADEMAAYNAFLLAFARALSDFSRGIDQRRRQPGAADASVRGRNAAIAVLTKIGPDERAVLFDTYNRMQDGHAVRTIINRLGGYITRP